MKLTKIEGNQQHLDGGAMFGNAPKELWKKWIAPDDHNRIPLASRGLLVQCDNGMNILLETGVGAFFDPKFKQRYGITPTHHVLLENLEAVGVPHTQIDAVVLSHLHFDHAGGLLPAHGEDQSKLLFPNAKYYVGEEHWQRAQKPHFREQASFIPHLQPLLKESKRLVLIQDEYHNDFGDNLRFTYSSGHTIGMLMTTVMLEKEPITFLADIAPGVPWVHLPITMGYDRFPELIVDEKRQLFDRIIAENGRVFFTHDPNVAFAKIMCVDGRYSCVCNT